MNKNKSLKESITQNIEVLLKNNKKKSNNYIWCVSYEMYKNIEKNQHKESNGKA